MSSLRQFGLAILFTGLVAGLAYTDDTPGTAPAAAAPAKAKKPKTPAEMRSSATELHAQINDDYTHILHLQGVARKAKDVIKLNCVNDKLIEVKAQMNIADTANQQLTGALDRGEDGAPLYSQLEGTAESVRQIREQANSCIGETELSKQENGVEVIRPEIPDDPGVIDPYHGDDGVAVEPPGYASPFN